MEQESVWGKINQTCRTVMHQITTAFINYGCVGVVEKICTFLVKVSIGVFFGKKGCKAVTSEYSNIKFVKKYQDKEEERIFQKWDRVWKSRETASNSDSSRTHFYELFKENYRNASLKRTKNRVNNFVWKSVFLFVMFGSLVGCAFLFYYCYVQKEMGLFQTLVSSGGLFAFITLICGMVSKWLDIKRYQATWVRHTYLLQQLNYEMLLYIYEMKYYDEFDKEAIFMLRVMDIWRNNLDKFTKDMEKNEKGMMDVFDKHDGK